MAVTFDRWHELAKELKLPKRSAAGEHLPKFPELDTESHLQSGDHSRENLARGYIAAIELPQRLTERKAELEADHRYSDEGRAEMLREFSKTVVDRGLKSLRDELLPHLRAEAADRMRSAKEAMPHPESGFEIAIAQEAWRLAREQKPTPMDIAGSSPAVQAAIALAPAEIVGMSPTSHDLVRKNYTSKFGGPELTSAENFAAAVDTFSETLDRVSVAIDLEQGIEPDHPMKVKREAPN